MPLSSREIICGVNWFFPVDIQLQFFLCGSFYCRQICASLRKFYSLMGHKLSSTSAAKLGSATVYFSWTLMLTQGKPPLEKPLRIWSFKFISKYKNSCKYLLNTSMLKLEKLCYTKLILLFRFFLQQENEWYF